MIDIFPTFLINQDKGALFLFHYLFGQHYHSVQLLCELSLGCLIYDNHGQVMLKSDQPLRQATSPTKGKESDSARALQVSGDPHRRPRPASGFLGLHWCLGSKPQELVVRPLTADSCTPRTAAAAAARTLRQSFISRTGSRSSSSSRAGCGHCLALLWHRYPQRLLLQQDFTSRPARHLPPAQLSQQRRKV